MVKKLNAKITEALDKACPIIDSKIVNKNNPWWTDLYKTKLKNYRKKC